MIFYDTRTDAGMSYLHVVLCKPTEYRSLPVSMFLLSGGLSVEQPTPTKVSGSPLCLDHPVSYFGTSAFLEMKWKCHGSSRHSFQFESGNEQSQPFGLNSKLLFRLSGKFDVHMLHLLIGLI